VHGAWWLGEASIDFVGLGLFACCLTYPSFYQSIHPCELMPHQQLGICRIPILLNDLVCDFLTFMLAATTPWFVCTGWEEEEHFL
jgi:hypothetical protein